MIRECARPYTPNEHVWLIQMLGNMEAKLNFIFPAAIPCPKNVSAPLMVPLADALHCYVFAPVFNFLCPSTGYPHYATAGCEQIDKIFYVNKFCPPTTFSIVLCHWVCSNPVQCGLLKQIQTTREGVCSNQFKPHYSRSKFYPPYTWIILK